jgi:hypothetical protein
VATGCSGIVARNAAVGAAAATAIRNDDVLATAAVRVTSRAAAAAGFLVANPSRAVPPPRGPAVAVASRHPSVSLRAPTPFDRTLNNVRNKKTTFS